MFCESNRLTNENQGDVVDPRAVLVLRVDVKSLLVDVTAHEFRLAELLTIHKSGKNSSSIVTKKAVRAGEDPVFVNYAAATKIPWGNFFVGIFIYFKFEFLIKKQTYQKQASVLRAKIKTWKLNWPRFAGFATKIGKI